MQADDVHRSYTARRIELIHIGSLPGGRNNYGFRIDRTDNLEHVRRQEDHVRYGSRPMFRVRFVPEFIDQLALISGGKCSDKRVPIADVGNHRRTFLDRRTGIGRTARAAVGYGPRGHASITPEHCYTVSFELV